MDSQCHLLLQQWLTYCKYTTVEPQLTIIFIIADIIIIIIKLLQINL